MTQRRLICCLLVAAGTMARSLPGATATGLSSFAAIEESLVKYFPATTRFEPDTFANITDVGGGTFRMALRYSSDWWDGDRDTTNPDRQRAEVKGLGPTQLDGDTFEYSTTWRANATFRGSNGFCHLFQLKAINGDSSMPLVTLSIRGNTATVEANPAGPKIVARQFPWKPATWQTVRIRIKTSPNADGELLISVDGDDFQGKTGVAMSRPAANEYRPKWGLYRKAGIKFPMGDDHVEHKNISAEKVGAPAIDNLALENEARRRAKSTSPEKALAWLEAQPATGGRDFAVRSIIALWAESQPAAAMVRADALPAGPNRDAARDQVFTRWADQDVTAAARWLHTRAPSAELDSLVWLFATDTTYRYVRRPVALAALPLIKDSELRARAFAHVVEIWSRQDAAAAADFLEKTDALSTPQKKAVAAMIKSRHSPGTPAPTP